MSKPGIAGKIADELEWIVTHQMASFAVGNFSLAKLLMMIKNFSG